jgi:hypothetical protein
LILTIIKLLLLAIVAVLALGALLWLIGLFIPAKRHYRTTIPVYLPVYLTLDRIEGDPFPKYFRGKRNGDAFVQRLDRKGRSTLAWQKVRIGDEIEWQAEKGKSVGGLFRYAVREKGIMCELGYQRVFIIRRPMMRVFGLLVSLRNESADVLKQFQPEAASSSNLA